ncbi:MAG: NUDIX hydrolase [Anaerolineales bacterium]|nr:NUDIX hydrolase [Anaerolineales bacterium]
MPFQRISSEPIYSGRAFDVRRDEVRLPDGRTTWLDVVEHKGSVVLLPLDAQGNLLFVRQNRHPAGQELLELPAGVVEDGEDPEACARRELREETGMAAGRLAHAGGFYLAPGYSTEYMDVFIATELRSDPLEADADEFLQVAPIPLGEALQMAENGNLSDAKTLAALLLGRSRLKEA